MNPDRRLNSKPLFSDKCCLSNLESTTGISAANLIALFKMIFVKYNGKTFLDGARWI